jgi:ribonuclease E
MTKRMLIDATHAEETRVVVLDGNRLEDFDVETSTKRQLKGNIYLAKVVRVEPSLQAAFVEYGGNRHGFLAFSEIHPDYYQIPVADRQRLIEMEAEEARREEEEADRALEGGSGSWAPSERAPRAEPVETGAEAVETGDESGATAEMLREAAATMPREAAPDAAAPALAPPVGVAETGDDSGATPELLRAAAAPAAEAPALPGDSVGGGAAGAEPGAVPGGTAESPAIATAGATVAAAAPVTAPPGSEFGAGVTGAAARLAGFRASRRFARRRAGR